MAAYITSNKYDTQKFSEKGYAAALPGIRFEWEIPPMCNRLNSTAKEKEGYIMHGGGKENGAVCVYETPPKHGKSFLIPLHFLFAIKLRLTTVIYKLCMSIEWRSPPRRSETLMSGNALCSNQLYGSWDELRTWIWTGGVFESSRYRRECGQRRLFPGGDLNLDRFLVYRNLYPGI